jgi:hypothetical protein
MSREASDFPLHGVHEHAGLDFAERRQIMAQHHPLAAQDSASDALMRDDRPFSAIADCQLSTPRIHS